MNPGGELTRIADLQLGRSAVGRQRDHANGAALLPRCADVWMAEKGARDRALTGCPPDRWLIHGRLYDLSSFIASHPGGPDWLLWTRGTDCTTEFETHHLDSMKVSSLLQKYDRGELNSPRPHAAEPYTWDRNGFFLTYKREAFAILKAAGGWGPTLEMQLTCAAAVFLWVLSNVAVGTAAGAVRSTGAAVLAGFMTYVCMAIGHNFFHQRDSLWRFAFDLSLFSSADWRLSHALSHHMLPNLDGDYEVGADSGDVHLSFLTRMCSLCIFFQASALEPHVRFMRSSPANRWPWLALVLHFILPFFLGPINIISRARDCLKGESKLRLEHAIPFIQLAVLARARGDLWSTFWLWFLLHGVAIWCLVYVSTPVHRSCYSWSSGCVGEQSDFGVHTAISTADWSSEETSPDKPLALLWRLFVYGSFNDHITHHLAPTVDLSRQYLLRPLFLRLARQYGIAYSKHSHPELAKGLLRVIMRGATDVCYFPAESTRAQ
jgi:hypothetical protein